MVESRYSSLVISGEKSDTEPPQNKKNNELTEEKRAKTEQSKSSPCRKMQINNKNGHEMQKPALQ